MAETYHPRGELVDGYQVREHPLYFTWADMKSRCNNSRTKSYVDYGGRGITYCDRWKHFVNFAADVGMPPFPGASIDRENNSKGYEPGNVRWATKFQQASNRRRFKNNKTGLRGSEYTKSGAVWLRYADEGVRYNLGRFQSTTEAVQFKSLFITMQIFDPEEAERMLIRRARLDSSTGIRGITKAKSGYIVRKTINKERVYLGHSADLETAIAMLRAG
jgi:hypothetical protein